MLSHPVTIGGDSSMNNYVTTINKVQKNIILNSTKKILIDGKAVNPIISEIGKNYIRCTIENVNYEFVFEQIDDENYEFQIDGNFFEATVRTKLKELAHQEIKNRKGSETENIIKAPMPGLLLKINKKVGDTINAGEPIIILEAMKMENEIKSPVSGKITEIYAEEGSNLEKNSKIIMIGF